MAASNSTAMKRDSVVPPTASATAELSQDTQIHSVNSHSDSVNSSVDEGSIAFCNLSKLGEKHLQQPDISTKWKMRVRNHCQASDGQFELKSDLKRLVVRTCSVCGDEIASEGKVEVCF